MVASAMRCAAAPTSAPPGGAQGDERHGSARAGQHLGGGKARTDARRSQPADHQAHEAEDDRHGVARPRPRSEPQRHAAETASNDACHRAAGHRSRPASAGEPDRTMPPELQQAPHGQSEIRLAQERHGPGVRDVPARVAQDSPRERVAVPPVETTERLLGARAHAAPPPPRGAPRRRAGRAPAAARRARRSRATRLSWGSAGWGARGGGSSSGSRHDLREHEAVAVPGNRPDEGGLARVVAERAPERAHGLAQGAVGDDHVGPDRVEDLPAVHGLAAALDEQHEQVEVARDERDLGAVAKQHAPRGRQHELAEDVARLARRCGHGGNARTAHPIGRSRFRRLPRTRPRLRG